MQSVSQNVWKQIKIDFSEPSIQAEVAEILKLYKGNECERVQFYILHLAKGNKEEVFIFTDEANDDYRNIIFWAENPEESQLNTYEKKQEMKELFQWLKIDIPDELKNSEK